MLKQFQNQKLSQTLSPQRVMLMKLLQVPTLDLNARVEEELMDNPALEIDTGDEDSTTDELKELDSEDLEKGLEEDYLQDDFEDGYDFDGGSSYYDQEDDNPNARIKAESSFHDHLLNQLNMLKLNEDDKNIGLQLIGSIDDDGFLRREPLAIKNDLYFSKGLQVDTERIESILERIQNFDPPGVGAQNLQETLLLQLERNPHIEEPEYQLAQKVLANYFNQFVKKRYNTLQTRLKISESQLKEVLDIITGLNPRPGNSFVQSSVKSSYIIPDFFVRNENGDLQLTLNSKNAPSLRISKQFQNILNKLKEGGKLSKQQKETAAFAKHKIDYANWFIESIKQRQNTLLSTMQAILEFQRDFFLSGDWMNIKPMILKDIAEIIEMDVSTVSRVVNQKYVDTEHGIFRLKEFFSESLINDDGEEVSSLNIKKALEDIIEKEDKRKPLSDLKLHELLKEKGYNLARRTVSKYREQLNIPVSRLRKEL